MKLAESAASRLALVLSTLVTGGLLVAATWPTQLAAPAKREPVKKIGGCGARAQRVVAPPPAQVDDPYVAGLRSARGELTACMAGVETQVRLAIDILPSGRVENVEVRFVTADDQLGKVDLKVVKCVQEAVSPLRFPVSPNSKRISTFLKP